MSPVSMNTAAFQRNTPIAGSTSGKQRETPRQSLAGAVGHGCSSTAAVPDATLLKSRMFGATLIVRREFGSPLEDSNEPAT